LLHLCPTCRRRFDESGFCPFDGASLVAGTAADQRTLVAADARGAQPTQISAAMPAQPAVVPVLPPDLHTLADAAELAREPATQLDVRRGTFPLTPKPGSVGTGEITAARSRPGASPAPPAGAAPPKIKAFSASENPSDALELYRAPRDNEYDKLIGQTLDGRYYVEKKIGEGGMGVVFSARHAVIERPLAIKVLKREAMRDTATIRRFVQEAKAASRIGHPNIVDVTDFGTTPDGMTYSVMEFVPGQTLGAALRAGAPFAPARAMRITAQIARALAAAHDKGIVHRDLKPENVFLLDRDGRPDFVKIVDFGIAKVTPPAGKTNEPRLTRAGSVFGTPEYMAPEQAAGRSDTDGRVDIYALGVITYEMICGRVPHRGDSMVRTLAMQMLDPIEPPSKVRPDLDLPPALEAVVMHALIKKREQRYQTMGELLEALDAILPTPVGQSVTGSPVYQLAPLPPGADPGLIAHPGMALASHERPPSQPSQSTQQGVEPARPPTTRRAKDEPQFTADDRPLSFQHVFTDELVPARGRRWPLLLFMAVIVGGAAGAVALVLKSHGAVLASPHDAGVFAPGDAALREPIDAPPDADEVIPEPEPDAGHAPRPQPRRDAGVPVIAMPDTPNHRGTILVQVITKPEGANLYDGYHYRGPGGTQVEEAYGTKLVLTCRLAGYKPGKVEVVFDGKTDLRVCTLARIKICVDNIKNPFDDCELDPNAPIDPK
jgi:serine/threonine protein kinase